MNNDIEQLKRVIDMMEKLANDDEAKLTLRDSAIGLNMELPPGDAMLFARGFMYGMAIMDLLSSCILNVADEAGVGGVLQETIRKVRQAAGEPDTEPRKPDEELH